MLVEDEEARHGNDRFEGYNVDLIRYISEVLKFNYTIHIVKDRSYGSYNEKNDTWNGMIGELLSQVPKSKLHQITNISGFVLNKSPQRNASKFVKSLE